MALLRFVVTIVFRQATEGATGTAHRNGFFKGSS